MNINIARLENNLYALNLAYGRLKKSIDSRVEVDIYATIGEVLIWVLTTDEWHLAFNYGYKIRRKSDSDGQVLFGLKHAYNLMKQSIYG
ncbi:hypothetical protein HYI18_03720 [Clostridium botulinum]|uniref:hypothetical protein n=1 Tax=Clostridium botulinum TaxID=1491 RepID=UPI00174C6A72|nr:hypothetical protein [Clostridium botulinum]MBD5637720.1 hypothetical protein [Clostridium botulinum]